MVISLHLGGGGMLPLGFFFEKLTPNSCNLEHSMIILVVFSKAIFLGKIGSES